MIAFFIYGNIRTHTLNLKPVYQSLGGVPPPVLNFASSASSCMTFCRGASNMRRG